MRVSKSLQRDQVSSTGIVRDDQLYESWGGPGSLRTCPQSSWDGSLTSCALKAARQDWMTQGVLFLPSNKLQQILPEITKNEIASFNLEFQSGRLRSQYTSANKRQLVHLHLFLGGEQPRAAKSWILILVLSAPDFHPDVSVTADSLCELTPSVTSSTGGGRDQSCTPYLTLTTLPLDAPELYIRWSIKGA